MQVNIFEAKNRLSELIRSVQAGQEVVIANRGAPVARLIPAEERSAGGAGDSRAIPTWLDGHPLPPHARRSTDELDAAIDETRAAWD